MIRKEICRVFDLIDKDFNNADRLKQAKMALENLNMVEDKLFKMKQYVVDEEYKLSERQKWAISTLKDIFDDNFIDFKNQKNDYRYFLSDIYWAIYDFFYDYGNKDPNLYKYELNCIYPYICLFKSQLNLFTKENEQINLDREKLLEFSLEYESGPVLYKAGDEVKDKIVLKRYYIDNDYQYESNINFRGEKKEIDNNKIKEIEEITKKSLSKLADCASSQTYSYISNRILDGVYEHIIIKLGGLELSINSSISDTKTRAVSRKYIDKVYDILK
ncbi:MAG: hypothetical protein IKJ30_07085 [Bacilli bacterium]|nr:hypothetical protein [Bacilli bacterium]